MEKRNVDGAAIGLTFSEIKVDISSGNKYLEIIFQNETNDMFTHLHLGFSQEYFETTPNASDSDEFILAEANAEADRFLNERGKELFDMADYYIYYASEFERKNEKFKPLD